MLYKFTNEELQAELERRKALAAHPLQPIDNPDFTILIKCVVDGVNETIKEQHQDSNLPYYVYEAAITAIYGNSYWEWRNKQQW